MSTVEARPGAEKSAQQVRPAADPRAQESWRQLEPRHYRDPEITELEERRIFGRTWQLVGHVGRLPNPGDYMTSTAGSQPVLVLRDEHGELRAFRNVCRHRGSRLLSGSAWMSRFTKMSPQSVSTRAVSRSTSEAGGEPPERSVAMARGSSLSGSGVIESHT